MKFIREYGWMFLLAAMFAVWAADSVLDLNLVPNPMLYPAEEVHFPLVKAIIEEKCVSCHGYKWTKYDRAYADRVQIKFRVWTMKNMPAKGEMTFDERSTIREWVDGGAKP